MIIIIIIIAKVIVMLALLRSIPLTLMLTEDQQGLEKKPNRYVRSRQLWSAS
jgi:hypothetical protein